MFAPADVLSVRRSDGSILLRSPQPLEPHERCIGEWLEKWAALTPERPFVMERGADGRWQGLTYGQALGTVRAAAAAFLQIGCSVEHPVAVLSENSVRHAMIALAAMHIGIPVAPVSAAYSLLSSDFEKLKAVIEQVRPGAIYASDATRFGRALAAIRPLHDAKIISDAPGADSSLLAWDALLATPPDEAVERAYRAVTPDTVAKLLFTSGSTGSPKAVVTTQRMLTVNQQQMLQVWPFLQEHAPILVDWLPWSHTFGGSHNFNMILRSGGTLFIDAGRPHAQHFEATICNLREVAPTLYFNVPRGFEMLLPYLTRDLAFRDHFFSRLRLLFCAAASLPQHLWDAFRQLSSDAGHSSLPFVAAWGSTETAPLATSCHFEATSPGVIGLPVPGCDLKLVPRGPKLEVRVKGPNVTPGYWKRPDLTAQIFDEEGFYLIGDAVRPVDIEHLERGLLFDGRIAEDFKLSSGTWVNAGAIRLRAIAVLAPLIQDVVVTGHDRDWVGLLLFPNVPACRTACEDAQGALPLDRLLADARVRESILGALQTLRGAHSGSSMYPRRALILQEPPSIDAGEITDKGYINQRAVLERRKALVEVLHSSSNQEDIIHLPD